ncbi:hypothetical protein HK097_000370, partial [Rhizophlyctis rosea]
MEGVHMVDQIYQLEDSPQLLNDAAAADQQQPEPCYLLAVNDDVLSVIMQRLHTSSYDPLSKTCHRLHTFLRHPQTVLSILKTINSPVHYLAYWPYWSITYDGLILDTILDSPVKPPLIHVERYLCRCWHDKRLFASCVKVLAKSIQWYTQMSTNTSFNELMDCFTDGGEYEDERLMPPSIYRFESAIEQMGDDRLVSPETRESADANLKRILEDEKFPLDEYFLLCEQEDYDITDLELDVLRNDRVKTHIKLSDLEPRLKAIATFPQTLTALMEIYNAAPQTHQQSFDRKVKFHLETVIEYDIYTNLNSNFPHVYRSCTQTFTLRTMSLRTILRAPPQANNNTLIDHLIRTERIYLRCRDLLSDGRDIIRRDIPLEGWCYALETMQKVYNYTSQDSEFHIDTRSFDKVMSEILHLAADKANPHARRWDIHPNHNPTTAYWDLLYEKIITGEIVWYPTPDGIAELVSDYGMDDEYGGGFGRGAAGHLPWGGFFPFFAGVRQECPKRIR